MWLNTDQSSLIARREACMPSTGEASRLPIALLTEGQCISQGNLSSRIPNYLFPVHACFSIMHSFLGHLDIHMIKEQYKLNTLVIMKQKNNTWGNHNNYNTATPEGHTSRRHSDFCV